jgi:hypothetical protein
MKYSPLVVVNTDIHVKPILGRQLTPHFGNCAYNRQWFAIGGELALTSTYGVIHRIYVLVDLWV